ncbi:MAG: hypothetical protein RML37_11595, partial [Chitinophagales bacterium]|nr:hypothetical protein [Chitinophagales bacterium]
AMQGSGVGLATGYAAASAAPARGLFFNCAGAAASLSSRPPHPSPEITANATAPETLFRVIISTYRQ